MLPDRDRVRVPDEKVRDYLVEPNNKRNGGKALFFARFGLTQENWPVLQEALKEHPVVHPLAATMSSSHGTKYVVECNVRTPDGRNPCIASVWIVDGVDPPRLVTAYPV